MGRAASNLIAKLVGSALVIAGVTVLAPRAAHAQVVQNCQTSQYLDRASPNDDRDIIWDFSISSDPERCIQIQAGQTVVFHGDVVNTHPIAGSGGTMPSPVDTNLVIKTVNGATTGSVTFPSPGIFGYQCLNHSSMKGAIQVIAASQPAAAPALSPWLALGLTLLLLTSGLAMIAGQRQSRRSADS